MAVMPAKEHAWLTRGLEMIVGFAVRADDIEWATSSAALVEALGLGFPGSPIAADAPFVDLLRFVPNGLLTLVDAVGGTTVERAAQLGGSFVQPPPFTGTGFVATDHVVPLWWVEPARVPAGAQLWRIYADGARSMLAVYPHVGIGWQIVPGLDIGDRHAFPPSHMLGIFTTYRGERLFADLLVDGGVIVASPEPLPGLTERSERGLWWTVVEASTGGEPVGYRVRAHWRGLPFDVVHRLRPRTATSRCSSTPITIAALPRQRGCRRRIRACTR